MHLFSVKGATAIARFIVVHRILNGGGSHFTAEFSQRGCANGSGGQKSLSGVQGAKLR